MDRGNFKEWAIIMFFYLCALTILYVVLWQAKIFFQ